MFAPAIKTTQVPLVPTSNSWFINLMNMIPKPPRIRSDVSFEIDIPLKEPSTAGEYGMTSCHSEVVLEVREGVEADVAVLTGEGLDHVVGEPMATAEYVFF